MGAQMLRSKVSLLVIALIMFTAFLIAGCSSPVAQGSVITPLDVPQEMAQLKPYLESHLPPEAKGAVSEGVKGNGKLGVVAIVQLEGENDSKEQVRQFTRDFVFAAYRTDFLIDVVAITLLKANGERALTVVVGEDTDAFLDKDVWKANELSADEFFDWLNSSKVDHDNPAESIVVAGDYGK
ncbi:hypothetical protein F9B85_03335 [Heliorestis acidaminivorans]|uniref:Uncharacterized protein n=1 Tax=Heliorestis acidaminivorans TaxID=553427 RepID=A0A6I0EYT5_9FIRM|nr:hypothetical protein [Heliorestis acidaminivorans]KAB2953666.1 hypothetical protein F9B85_03335 [Heliorestis acidaminivorans]